MIQRPVVVSEEVRVDGLVEQRFERLGREPFDHATDMLKALPALVRLQGYRSVYGLVSRYIKNPQLRMVFSFHPLLVGGNPLTTTSVYTLIAHLEKRWGVHYVMGGTGRRVAALVELIEGLGGRFRYDAEVARIVVQDGAARGVVLRSGETLDADVVVLAS